MKKLFKWIGIVVAGLLGLAVVVLAGMYISTGVRINKNYSIQPEPVAILTDEASLARGKHWAEMHCQFCHGEDLGGGPFFEDPMIGYVDASNLTSGKGGVGSVYTDADWVRAIRHGVKINGKSVFIMPANDFYYLNDADLGGIIAYVKSVPPVDREIRRPYLSPTARVLYALGAFGDQLFAEIITHDVRPPAPAQGVTVEYGGYLVKAHGCETCHGADLRGKQPAEPGSPYAPDLTRKGELIGWTETDFFIAMRTGVTPNDRTLSDSMPWKGLGKMTDDELKAVWMFLQAQNGAGD